MRRGKLKSAYQQVFLTSEGKVVLNDLLARCGVLELGFSANSRQDAFDAGRRAIGKHLFESVYGPVREEAQVDIMQQILGDDYAG